MPLFIPRLVNDPFGDAALLLRSRRIKAGLLFDMGDLHALSVKELLKISHVFVSHTHMDHFAGFEQLLRQNLSRPAPLYLYGPRNFIKQVKAKLKGFTWNLIKDPCYTLEIVVTEVRPRGLLRQSFCAVNCFAPQKPVEKLPFTPVLLDTAMFSVSCAIFDHGTPCLGFALTEKAKVNINAKALQAMELLGGPWLKTLLNAVNSEQNDDMPITALAKNGRQQTYALKTLQADLIKIKPAYKLVYITDLAYTKSNIAQVLRLAQNADLLYLEAAFAQADTAHAEAKKHLTAQQAGALIKACNVKAWQVFHFSPKYQKHKTLIWNEVCAAVENPPPLCR